MTMPKTSLTLARMQRRQAAFEAFQQGASMEEACNKHAIEQHELEDMVRLRFELNVEELAGAIAVEIKRTQPAEIQRIADWLRRTMIWIFAPDADLVAVARANVDFSNYPGKDRYYVAVAIPYNKQQVRRIFSSHHAWRTAALNPCRLIHPQLGILPDPSQGFLGGGNSPNACCSRMRRVSGDGGSPESTRLA